MPIRADLTPYQIGYERKAQKALEALSDENLERVLLALQTLALTAHGDVKFLGDGYVGEYRLRVGDLRIFFDVVFPERIIRVAGLEKRGQAYKKKSKR
jgi:mRNA-degrading endonuclease RelE of RelBE toxin-antitoxin system